MFYTLQGVPHKPAQTAIGLSLPERVYHRTMERVVGNQFLKQEIANIAQTIHKWTPTNIASEALNRRLSDWREVNYQ